MNAQDEQGRFGMNSHSDGFEDRLDGAPRSLRPAPRKAPTLVARGFDAGLLLGIETLLLRLLRGGLALLATVLAGAGWSGLSGQALVDARLWAVLVALFAAAAPLHRYAGLGDSRLGHGLSAVRAALDAGRTLLLVQGLLGLAGWPLAEPGFLLILFGMLSAFGLVGRWLAEQLLRVWSPRLRVAILGAGEQGLASARHLAEHEPAIEVVGFIDDRRSRLDPGRLPFPLLASTQALDDLPEGLDGVVIALPASAGQRVSQLASCLRGRVGSLYLAPESPLLGQALCDRPNQGPQRMLLLGINPPPFAGRVCKRLFDLLFALAALSVFLPCGVLIAVLIKLESPGPVLFKQQRYGRGNRLFTLYKFRSMGFEPQADDREIRLTEHGDRRLTRIGEFLRRTSLDETPQLFNVLLGQMSLVGPRPHPPGVKASGRLYEVVEPDFAERYKVRPGLTGWAQVNGLRGNTFTEAHLSERFVHDIRYLQHWSMELDLWILGKTLLTGLGGQNAF